MKYKPDDIEAFTPHTVWTANVRHLVCKGDLVYNNPYGYRIYIPNNDQRCTILAGGFDAYDRFTMYVPNEQSYDRYVKGLSAFPTYRTYDFYKN